MISWVWATFYTAVVVPAQSAYCASLTQRNPILSAEPRSGTVRTSRRAGRVELFLGGTGLASNHVPGLLAGGRRELEFLEYLGEVCECTVAGRAHLIRQLPNVARHIQRAIRTGAGGKGRNRQQPAAAHVGPRRVLFIAPREEKALLAASRLFPFAALRQALAGPLREGACIQDRER